MVIWHKQLLCRAFEGSRQITSGGLEAVARATKEVLDRGEQSPVVIFDDATSEVVEVDFRGTVEEVVARLPPGPERCDSAPAENAPRGRGRPRLGVVAREVTLLPAHWEYLGTQPGGASVALRKLVDQASRTNGEKDRIRKAQEAAYRFMSAMAGNFPGFEEAVRALFAGESVRFVQETDPWDDDVRDHARRLASRVFQPSLDPAASYA